VLRRSGILCDFIVVFPALPRSSRPWRLWRLRFEVRSRVCKWDEWRPGDGLQTTYRSVSWKMPDWDAPRSHLAEWASCTSGNTLLPSMYCLLASYCTASAQLHSKVVSMSPGLTHSCNHADLRIIDRPAHVVLSEAQSVDESKEAHAADFRAIVSTTPVMGNDHPSSGSG